HELELEHLAGWVAEEARVGLLRDLGRLAVRDGMAHPLELALIRFLAERWGLPCPEELAVDWAAVVVPGDLSAQVVARTRARAEAVARIRARAEELARRVREQPAPLPDRSEGEAETTAPPERPLRTLEDEEALRLLREASEAPGRVVPPAPPQAVQVGLFETAPFDRGAELNCCLRLFVGLPACGFAVLVLS